MRVSYFVRDNGACGYYRVDLPLTTACDKRSVETMRIEKGDSGEKISAALEADVIVFPRPNEEILVGSFKELQNEGKKVVIDFDDNMFLISPLSPHYKDFGTEEVKYKMPDGKVIDLWTDGKNFDLKENIKRIDNVKRALETASLVTAPTRILADVYKEYGAKKTAVLPNCVDMDLWQKLPLKETDKIRLFWAGGYSHYEDWLILRNVIPVIMQKYPNVVLVLMGAMWKSTLEGIPGDRIEFHKWVPTSAYPYKVSILNPDIAIIPLSDTDFNRCKSPIKWIEMAAMGVPSVTSNIPPYSVIASEHNGIFIDKNAEDAWIEGISMLIEDTVLLAKIGGYAQRTVNMNFDIKTEYTQWVKAYHDEIWQS